MNKKSKNTRAIATQVLVKVVSDGQSFQPLMIPTTDDPRDHGFIANLCFGVLRFYYCFQDQLKQFLQKPIKAKDEDVTLLIMVGLYQLLYTDIPSYAILHSTVNATQDLKKPWARALVNGILRKAMDRKEELLEKTSNSQPKWLMKAYQKAWPNEYSEILQANLSHPPLSVRINEQKSSLDHYLTLLNETELKGEPLANCPMGLLIIPEVNVYQLPGFQEGLLSVQDGASQLVAPLLDLKPGLRILDACAAPGGKTAHILEKMPSAKVTAIEIDSERLLRLKETLSRLGCKASVICADASDVESWWDKQPFDRILLDPPCSATGIIRRHPDIAIHRQKEDIQDLVGEQAHLLNTLWALLKPGGILVYSTCSILPEENVDQMVAFLENTPDASEWKIEGNWGIEQRVGRQILPGQENMDGFYYARLRKIVIPEF